ncbi:MAG TPA: hypothetical protein VN643_15645 [Pyrinomonadaceae bacterium]|nr:hypothetical protein [Pyrinomonadaceae bacterium]
MSCVSPKNELLIETDLSDVTKRRPMKLFAGSRWASYGFVLCLALLCCSVAAQAQLPGEPTPSPTPAAGMPAGLNKLVDFYKKITSNRGFRLVNGSVAPGSGTTVGVGYNGGDKNQRWRVNYGASARVSIKKYWELDTNVRLIDSTPNSNTDIVDKMRMNFYAVVKDMPRLDFFGIGPNSREQDRAVFHYREAAAGFDIVKPVAPVLDIGGAIEGIFPRIITIKNPTIRSVERVYSNTSAPGIASQPNFLHLAGFAELHSSGEPESRKLSYKFFFHYYRDGRDHKYSFRRFDADLSNKFPFGKDGKNEFRVRGRLSFSDTSSGQRVPFYLMQTLGGSNIRGADTLRGFRDYRFRDRDLLLLQLEYLRNLKGPIDFIAFYDTGKVAPAISRLDVGRLRHTYGLGLVFVQRRLEDVAFRFYVSFGSGEGTHTYLGLTDPLGGRGDRLFR